MPANLVITGFNFYLRPDRVRMVFGDSVPHEGVEVLARGKRRIGLRVVDWAVLRQNSKPPRFAIDPDRLEARPYPLTNREWSELLNARRSR